MALQVALKDVSLTIEVTIPGSGPRAYSIPPGMSTAVHGGVFLELSRRNATLRRLLTCQAVDFKATDAAFSALGNTDVLDQLMQIRKQKVLEPVVGDNAKKLGRRWHTKNKYQAKLAALSAVLEVDAPEVADVPPVKLRVLSPIGIQAVAVRHPPGQHGGHQRVHCTDHAGYRRTMREW